ncbi:MAG: helix-turn-helix domain-containing protein [Rhodospirillaceae bacterium]|nr:helix-turn-helix domain-containing protein [Rhodospirillaceae bacterium]
MNDTTTPDPAHESSSGPFANLGHARQQASEPPLQASDVGTLLCATRMRLSKDLQEIAAILHIRYNFLVAIEDGRYEDLPGQAYAMGFVRAYADHLGLDGDEVVRRYKEETAGIKRAVRYDYPIPAPESGIPSGALLTIAVVLGMVVYGVWYSMADADRRAADVIQEVPDRLAALLDNGASQTQPAVETNGAIENEETSPEAETDVTPVAEMTPAVDEMPAKIAEPVIEPKPGVQVAVAPPSAAPPSAAPPSAAPPSAASVVSSTAPAVQPPAASPPKVATPTSTPREQSPSVPTVDSSPSPPVTQAPQSTPSQAEPPKPAVTIPVVTPPTATGPAPTTQVAKVEPPAISSNVLKPAPVATATVPTTPPVTTAPPQPASQTASATATQTAPAKPPAAQTASAGRNVVELRAKSDSWIQVRDGEQLLLTRFLRKGETYRVPDRSGLTLMTLNAGGIEIMVDGDLMLSLGEQGSVARAVALDAQKLKSQPKPSASATPPAPNVNN